MKVYCTKFWHQVYGSVELYWQKSPSQQELKECVDNNFSEMVDPLDAKRKAWFLSEIENKRYRVREIDVCENA